MSRRVEVNPGEMFMVADRMILVREYESVLADVQKIGGPAPEVAYLFTFTGRVNRTDETSSVTVAISPEDAFELINNVLSGLELLAKANPASGDAR